MVIGLKRFHPFMGMTYSLFQLAAYHCNCQVIEYILKEISTAEEKRFVYNLDSLDHTPFMILLSSPLISNEGTEVVLIMNMFKTTPGLINFGVTDGNCMSALHYLNKVIHKPLIFKAALNLYIEMSETCIGSRCLNYKTIHTYTQNKLLCAESLAFLIDQQKALKLEFTPHKCKNNDDTRSILNMLKDTGVQSEVIEVFVKQYLKKRRVITPSNNGSNHGNSVKSEQNGSEGNSDDANEHIDSNGNGADSDKPKGNQVIFRNLRTMFLIKVCIRLVSPTSFKHEFASEVKRLANLSIFDDPGKGKMTKGVFVLLKSKEFEKTEKEYSKALFNFMVDNVTLKKLAKEQEISLARRDVFCQAIHDMVLIMETKLPNKEQLMLKLYKTVVSKIENLPDVPGIDKEMINFVDKDTTSDNNNNNNNNKDDMVIDEDNKKKRKLEQQQQQQQAKLKNEDDEDYEETVKKRKLEKEAKKQLVVKDEEDGDGDGDDLADKNRGKDKKISNSDSEEVDEKTEVKSIAKKTPAAASNGLKHKGKKQVIESSDEEEEDDEDVEDEDVEDGEIEGEDDEEEEEEDEDEEDEDEEDDEEDDYEEDGFLVNKTDKEIEREEEERRRKEKQQKKQISGLSKKK